MIIETGNLFDFIEFCDVLCITTNSVIKTDGSLVMGAGIAKTVRDIFPGIDFRLGQQIQKGFGNLSEYNLIFDTDIPMIGAFQTKIHFSEDSKIDVIKNSINKLKDFALNNIEKVIYLSYPGIHHGRLSPEIVEPHLQGLPNNVFVWKLK